MSHTARLVELGIVIPEVVPPVAAYVPAVVTGRYVYTTVSGSGAAAAVGISKFQYFDGLDAGSGDPVAGQFVLRTPAIAKTSTASSTGLGS